MFNKKLKANLKAIDVKIGNLIEELSETEKQEEQEMILVKIDDLTKIREKLSNNKVSESYSKELISGAIGLTSMVLVLRFEKADIITSKAFGLVPNLFKRGN